jgi:hypothetical protein
MSGAQQKLEKCARNIDNGTLCAIIPNYHISDFRESIGIKKLFKLFAFLKMLDCKSLLMEPKAERTTVRKQFQSKEG